MSCERKIFDANGRKTVGNSITSLAILMAEAEKKTYVTIIRNGKEDFETLESWREQGCPGELVGIVQP